MRGLRFYDLPVEERLASPEPGADFPDAWRPSFTEDHVPAQSRFRSLRHPERFALYTVHETDSSCGMAPIPDEPWWGEHTLRPLREFRRVPLDASALALLLFTARADRTAQVLAALAHFAERAVSLYQPAYLLLAHSLEAPRISALLMGVQECAALQASSSAAFSVDLLLPELRPLLATDPEWFAYWPEARVAPSTRLVSPHAV